jgi:hypothetical protein
MMSGGRLPIEVFKPSHRQIKKPSTLLGRNKAQTFDYKLARLDPEMTRPDPVP